MRAVYPVLFLGILSACAPAIPDSGAGIGFDNSPEVQEAREVALTTGQPMVPPGVVSGESLTPAPAGTTVVAGTAPLSATAQPVTLPPPENPTNVAAASSGSAQDIAAETAAALAAASANSGVMPVVASPSNPPPPISNPGISDENDFTAVSARQTIESDAERIARNKAQYQVIAPTAVPQRTAASQPNIVSYALQTNNPLGTRVYSRAGFNLEAKAARNCAAFASPDQAQIAFLEKGGPQRDRKGLDPDGDGYACNWDPAPFRQAVKN